MIALMVMALAGEAAVPNSHAVFTLIDPPPGVAAQDPERVGQWAYSTEALESNVSGTARIRLGLAGDGTVNRCDILASSGHEALDRASCSKFDGESVVFASESGKLPFTIDAQVTWTLPAADDPTRARVDWQIFTDEDYPPEAIEIEAEGLTTVELKLSKAGKVAGCTVMQSSGNEALDSKTCEVFIERGSAKMAGSSARLPPTTVSRVKWVLPEGAAFQNWEQQVKLRTAGETAEVTCVVDGDADVAQLDEVECESAQMIVTLLQNGEELPDGGEATLGRGMIEGSELRSIEAKMGGNILMRGAARISVSDKGRVTKCAEIEDKEWKRAAPSAKRYPTCAEVRGVLFERLGEREREKRLPPKPGVEAPVREGILYHYITVTDRISDG